MSIALLWPLAKRFTPLAKRFTPLALICGLLIYVMIERGNARHFKKLWQAEQSVHAADILKWKAASEEATRRATAEKQAEDARTAQIKDKADANLTDARDDARRAADAYARLHAATANNQGRPGGTDLSVITSAAPLDHGLGADAVMVSRADFDLLNDNTVRLKNAHDWGMALGGQR